MAINGFWGLMLHDFTNKNKHVFTSNSEFHLMEIVNNPEMKTKYVYSDEFLNYQSYKPIDIDKLNITECYKKDKPLCYHIYNTKKLNHFKMTYLCSTLFIILLKMHQMYDKIGGKLIGVFTDTIVVEEFHVRKDYWWNKRN